MTKVLSIIGIVVLIALVAAGVYVFLYQQQRINDLQSDNDILKQDLDAAKNIDNVIDENINGKENLTSYTSKKGVSITVNSPARGSKVASPLKVTGSVPGSWSFESQFVIRLLDNEKNVLAEEPATLEGEWMTESMVPFSATLSFTAPANGDGSLVLEKANPSGMAENDDSVTIPVQF